MGDSFWGFILDKWPWIFVIAISVVVGIFIGKLISRFKKLEKDCDKISEIEKSARIYEQSSLRIEKSVDERLLPSIERSNNRIDAIVLSLNGLGVYLGQKDKTFNTGIIQAKSPVQLTELGLELLHRIGGDKYVDQNLDKLIGSFNLEKIKSALDVQNQSTLILLDQTNSDEFVPIKNYIYNNPVYVSGNDEITLNIHIAVTIMGIYLRNKYLEKHPELIDNSTKEKL